MGGTCGSDQCREPSIIFDAIFPANAFGELAKSSDFQTATPFRKQADTLREVSQSFR